MTNLVRYPSSMFFLVPHVITYTMKTNATEKRVSNHVS